MDFQTLNFDESVIKNYTGLRKLRVSELYILFLFIVYIYHTFQQIILVT
jgi:hypothetical protein